LGVAGAFQGLGMTARAVFSSALESTGRGFSGAGPNVSFLSGLTGILKQLGGVTQAPGPGLGSPFRAALPVLQAVTKSPEQAARAILPAMPLSLKQMTPYLPILIQGFRYLSQGLAGLIVNLGPGMRSAAIIFKGAMQVTKGLLQLTGYA